MANDRNRTDEQFFGPEGGRPSDSNEDRTGSSGVGEDVRGVADEGDEDFEDMDDLEEEEEEEDSF